MKKVNIGNKLVGVGQPIFIIAEAGVNHNGDLGTALKLVDAAAEAGADAVKFQTFKAEDVVIAQGEMAEYQKRNLAKRGSQSEMLRDLELPESFYVPILRRCLERNIIFLSAPHGHIKSVDFLNALGISAFKFGSGDLTNRPLLEYAARFKKPMILGTGMSTMKEVIEAAHWIGNAGNHESVFLHCTTNYPCPPEEVNLKAMRAMMEHLPEVMVGYSDHTLGIHTAVMAVMMGAVLIEKHLTLDSMSYGPDHAASADPVVFKEMVEAIRSVSVTLGSSVKKPTKSELGMIPAVRKSLVSLRLIRKGEVFSEINLGIKRPGTGVAPKFYNVVLGKVAKREIASDTLILRGDW